MPFEFIRQSIPDVILVRPRIFSDDRGAFLETYKREDFEKAGIRGDFLQDNVSRNTRRGVLRGLHFQRDPNGQAKIVRCTRGRIYDVAVDVRRGSETFGKFVAMELGDDDAASLYVPRGFAHGYLSLTDGSEVLYKVDGPYAPNAESGLLWNDPDVGIPWPVKDPILIARDRELPRLSAL